MEHAWSTKRQELNLEAVWRSLWRGKFVILGLMVAAALGAISYLNGAAYLYTAQLKVVPATVGGEANPSGGLKGLASIAGLGGSDTSDLPFLLYKQGLHSRDVAEMLSRDQVLMRRLFAGEWDAQSQRWVEPRSTRATLVASVKRMLGLPVYPWKQPDAARLQSMLESRIVLNEAPASPVVTVQFSDPDPQFAVEFLTLVNRSVDQTVRRRTIRKTGDYIRYLSTKLATVSLVDHRASLAAELAAQERQRMTASSAAPFAAEPIDQVVASAYPTSPRPTLVLGAALLAGLLLGTSLVLVLSRKTILAAPRTSEELI